MAQLQWITQDNPFSQGQESALNSAKETTANLMTGSYLNGFGFKLNNNYVNPQEYYSNNSDKIMESQFRMWDKISQLESENEKTKNKYYQDKENWLNEKEQLINRNSSTVSDYRKAASTTTYSTPSDEIVSKAIEYGKKYGINPAELLAKAEIESSFNPKAGNQNYKGLFAMDYNKFGDKVYDLDFAFKYASESIRDASNVWKKQGIDAGFGHKYLLWQQGIAGASALWKARESGVLAKDAISKFYKDGGRRAIAGNLVKAWGFDPNTVTAKQFTDAWIIRSQETYTKWDNYLKNRG